MHPQVNAIAGRMSLRTPQRRALEILDRVTEVVPPRKGTDVEAADVLAKRDAALAWCRVATEYAEANGGKPWVYVLISHDAIAENWRLQGLVDEWSRSRS